MANVLSVGGLLYPGFEMLDLYGPLEMFSLLGSERVELALVAGRLEPVPSAIAEQITLGPKSMPDAEFGSAPGFDVLVVPGGFGTRPALEDQALLDFLRRQAEAGAVIASVCTGSVLLARAGLLDGRRATSNKQLFDFARRESAPVTWVEAARWVVDGNCYTASGVSAGMDMALALIADRFDVATAEQIAVAAEYQWHKDADNDPFVEHLNALAALV